jgi:2-polyprenyl-6-methoxyphenol hydroxylase-like FAD-dependent oxidoreductase
VLPHGVRVLTELGLAEALAEVSVETRAIEYRSRDGRLIHSDPRGRHAGLAFPQLSVHRGNLHTVLYRALLEYPIGANGSSQALLDAEAIAEGVAASPRDLPAAFAAFQARRLDAANAVVLANRARGPEKLLQLADERIAAGEVPEGGPILPAEAIDAVTLGYRRTAGFEREALAAMSARPRLWP